MHLLLYPKEKKQKLGNNMQEGVIFTLSQKIVVNPKDAVYCQAQVKLNNNPIDKDLISIPIYGEERVKIHKALYKFSTEEDISRTLTKSKTKKTNTFNIYIFIENSL